MVKMLIRVNAELTEELSAAFPHLLARRHCPSTTLSGEVADSQELFALFHLLDLLGVEVVEMFTIPED